MKMKSKKTKRRTLKKKQRGGQCKMQAGGQCKMQAGGQCKMQAGGQCKMQVGGQCKMQVGGQKAGFPDLDSSYSSEATTFLTSDTKEIDSLPTLMTVKNANKMLSA
jgi:hypothetical protein